MPSLIELTNDYKKHPLGRAVPGAFFDSDRRAWCVDDPTPRSAAVALKLFPELALTHPELEVARDKLAQDVRPFDKATEMQLVVNAEGVRDALHAEDKEFYEFQELDMGYLAAVMRRHGAAYIGWERGLGKTLAACGLIDELGCKRVLVIAPNTAKSSVWLPELERWLPEAQVRVLPNTKAKRERTINAWKLEFAGDAPPQVLIAHYEALALIDWRKLPEWDLVIADEAHRLKNPKTKLAKAIKKIPTVYKLALSGSIIQNHAEELFSPLQWMFPEVYKSKWRDWNDRYLDFVDSGYGRVCIGIKHERLAQMRDELGVFMVYRRKEDELDLPPKTEQTLGVDLLPAQRKAYNELRDTCVVELESEKVKAQEGLVMLTRLRQLATGLELLDGECKSSSKLDLAVDLIEDAQDEAFVVFTWYKAAGHALAARLRERGEVVYLVDGDVKQEDRAQYIDEFQSGEGRIFIGTISTLGESVTLHRATNAIFLDRSWNPAMNQQAADRIYRIGQDKPVTITHLVARNTVDELRVLPTIANKEALIALILGAAS